jgi:glutamine amidotransferase
LNRQLLSKSWAHALKFSTTTSSCIDMKTKTIVLIDAGTGNLRSVHKALEHAGAEVIQTTDPRLVADGGRLVLPGVGAFGDFMRGLRERDLRDAILQAVQRGDPLLGICVGMQALFELGEEHGIHPGLGLLPGRVIRFTAQEGVKIPHTGWNRLEFKQPSPLWNKLVSGAFAYFNHAYYCEPANPKLSIASTDHGVEFACSVQSGQLFGVQFHPEKSQRVGLQILENFITLTD